MINNQYKPLYQKVQRMQYNMQNHVSASANPAAYAMHREMNSLLADMRANRNPRVIDSRMKTIQRQMSQVSHQSPEFSAYGNAAVMNHGFNQMRTNVRSFYNFH